MRLVVLFLCVLVFRVNVFIILRSILIWCLIRIRLYKIELLSLRYWIEVCLLCMLVIFLYLSNVSRGWMRRLWIVIELSVSSGSLFVRRDLMLFSVWSCFFVICIVCWCRSRFVRKIMVSLIWMMKRVWMSLRIRLMMVLMSLRVRCIWWIWLVGLLVRRLMCKIIRLSVLWVRYVFIFLLFFYYWY